MKSTIIDRIEAVSYSCHIYIHSFF